MANIPTKVVAQRTYVHVCCLDLLDKLALEKVKAAEQCAGVQREARFNVVRLDPGLRRVSLLHYPNFFDAPCPPLRESWLVDLETEHFSYRTYHDSLNPPILHRKELLLPTIHPRHAEYAAFTQSAESIGLFDKPTHIGFKAHWERLIREKGYQVIGHQLVPIGNDDSELGNAPPGDQSGAVARHLTALVRYGFSAPVQSLARYGFLHNKFTVFDYGCGRGDDLRGLQENGITAAGWDPFFAADNEIKRADIVNLGFVINVIVRIPRISSSHSTR